ncbi:hypothetical protein DFH06DRAFT_1370238 [Mycena polygramma]|nr:hypothetical protein DFH06DRAFT_1370238 [Mycena polygramma]
MTTVPQELIDEILYNVDDIEGLKACALVGSSFREPSQRILLHSHTLIPSRAEQTRDFLALLAESPHIAAYLTRFNFRLNFSPDAISAAFSHLQGTLDRLGNVRHCTIVGGSWRKPWDDTTRISALIPVKTQILPTRGLPMGSVLTQLVLDETTDTICDVLSRPAFAPYMTAVRKLKMSPVISNDGSILSSVFRTLDHLCIDCTLLIIAGIFLDLPGLAVLRVIELTMPAYKDSARWLVDTLFPALVSAQTPALKEIRITYPLGLQQFVIPAETLHAIDALMGGFPQLPRLCWHVGFDRADAAALIQQGMPMMHRLGKVFVRGYSD